jgi:hypothetical protein
MGGVTVTDITPELRELLDRQQIRDCIYRAMRGIDRQDKDLMLSAYHDDAFDNHGAYAGHPSGMFDWAISFIRDRGRVSQHAVTNHLVDIDENVAHAETYFTYYLVHRDDADADFGGGRYVDRFERRQGQWRIAERATILEWGTVVPGVGGAVPTGGAFVTGTWDRDDISYQRPLHLPRGDSDVS